MANKVFVLWGETYPYLCVDVLLEQEIRDKSQNSKAFEHEVIFPNSSRPGKAKYRIYVTPDYSDLDYGGDFKTVNEKAAMEPGVMRLLFAEDESIRVEWSDGPGRPFATVNAVACRDVSFKKICSALRNLG